MPGFRAGKRGSHSAYLRDDNKLSKVQRCGQDRQQCVEITGGPCVELAGTKYTEEAEYQLCPVLDDAMPAEWKLLAPGQREMVETEIANARKPKS